MIKKFRITVDGKAYEVEVEEIGAEGQPAPPQPAAPQPRQTPQAAKQSAPAPKTVPKQVSAGSGGISAPMPGTVLQVLVKQGDKVKEGQPLLILEAMKMENNITAPNAGTVTVIAVSQGQNVESGQHLLTIS